MIPIGNLRADVAGAIRFVMFDIDDTMTRDGLLLAESYDAIWKLREAGFVTVPVTGRPAGWCDLISREWPVSGVVGENGGFAFYMKDGKLERLFHPAAPEPRANKGKLDALGREAIAAFPGLRVAKDQPYRLFDLALDFAEEEPDLGLETAARVRAFCEARGAVAKVSSIHVNAWYGLYDKLSMVEYFLSRVHGYDPAADAPKVFYLGDSPNDEPMFGRFPNSCGVANVRRFESVLEHPPRFVTEGSHGLGFREAVMVFLERHGV